MQYRKEIMNEPRDINQFINNASIVVVIDNNGFSDKVYFEGIPEIHDEVSLNTEAGYSMTVEITDYSEIGKSFFGKVTHGYYPENEENTIEIGDIVCFSKEKIGGIFRK